MHFQASVKQLHITVNGLLCLGSCDYSLTSVHLTEVLSLWLGHSINDQSSGSGLWENGHSLPRGSLEDQVRQLQNPGPDLPPVTLDHVLVSLNH